MTRYVDDVYDEDDVPPYIGERIVGSLRRQFEQHFGAPLERPKNPTPDSTPARNETEPKQ